MTTLTPIAKISSQEGDEHDLSDLTPISDKSTSFLKRNDYGAGGPMDEASDPTAGSSETNPAASNPPGAVVSAVGPPAYLESGPGREAVRKPIARRLTDLGP